MKQKLLYTLFTFLCIQANAQTLSAGDIAFIGYNTDTYSGTIDHDFTFISLTNIPAGEVIYFTEQGWNNSTGWLANAEGHYSWTAPVGGISCGTIIHIYENGASSETLIAEGGGSMSSILNGSGWNLSGGDQVLAYQSTTGAAPGNPVFISGIHGDYTAACYDSSTTWNLSSCIGTGVAYSELPSGLSNSVDCISLFPAPGLEFNNAKYTGTLTGDSSTLRGLINNYINWTSNDGSAYDISPSAYSPSVTCAAPCTDPDVPTVTYSPATVCSGNNATLTISGNLNDATAWHIYTGSCGGSSLGSTASSSFVVAPSSPSTTYYVRGEGGCVTPGSCGSVTVNVTALDNASFSYDASTYETTDSDPTPTITGLGGGTFSSTAGLSISGSTGTIDVSASTPNSYTVTYTTSGPCPNASNVNVTINTPLGLNDLDNINEFSLYPNPSKHEIVITSILGGDFKIINSLGQVVKAFKVAPNKATPIQVSGLSEGLYFIKSTNSNAQKLVIKH